MLHTKMVYSLSLDCQDGSGFCKLFNSEEERLEYLRRNDEYEERCSQDKYDPENHDGFEDGYLDERAIVFEIIDGEVILKNTPSFSWGDQ